MANNHEQFIAFDDTIALSQTKEDELKKNRKALREKIRKYFKDNKSDEIQPKFNSQGSFVMKTTVNPIPKWSDEDKKNLYKYDIDDGVYFMGNEEPADRYEEQTYHNWIYDAVADHTSKGAQDRTTCVRVLYADGHHIDLPIYYKRKDIKNSIPELAHTSKEWLDSDPEEFYKWFNTKADSNKQLRRVVRYFKAWADYKNTMSSTKMPPGFILTILVTNSISYDERDDIAMKETLINIQNKIDDSKGGTFKCYRPTTPSNEDLFAGYSDTRKNNFLNNLDSFVKSASQAIGNTNQKDGCLKWQKHFGERFSCSTAKDEEEQANLKTYSSPAIINQNAKSA